MNRLFMALRSTGRFFSGIFHVTAIIPAFLAGVVFCIFLFVALTAYLSPESARDDLALWFKREVFSEQQTHERLDALSKFTDKWGFFILEDNYTQHNNPYNEIVSALRPTSDNEVQDKQSIYDKDLALGLKLNALLQKKDTSNNDTNLQSTGLASNESHVNKNVLHRFNLNDSAPNDDLSTDGSAQVQNQGSLNDIEHNAYHEHKADNVHNAYNASMLYTPSHAIPQKTQPSPAELSFLQNTLETFVRSVGIEQKVFPEQSSKKISLPLSQVPQSLVVAQDHMYKKAAFISTSLFTDIFGSDDKETAPTQESITTTKSQEKNSQAFPNTSLSKPSNDSRTTQDTPTPTAFDSGANSSMQQLSDSELRLQLLRKYRLEGIHNQIESASSDSKISQEQESSADLLEQELVARTQDLFKELLEQQSKAQEQEQKQAQDSESFPIPQNQALTYTQNTAKIPSLTKEQEQKLLNPNSAGWDAIVASDYPILYDSTGDARFITSLYKDPDDYQNASDWFWVDANTEKEEYTKQFIAPTYPDLMLSGNRILTFHQAREQLNLIKKHLCSKGICEENYAQNPELYQSLLNQGLYLWWNRFSKEQVAFFAFKKMLEHKPKAYLVFVSTKNFQKLTTKAIDQSFQNLPQQMVSNLNSTDYENKLALKTGIPLGYLKDYLLLYTRDEHINVYKDEVVAYPRFEEVWETTDSRNRLINLANKIVEKDLQDSPQQTHLSDSIKEEIQKGQDTLNQVNKHNALQLTPLQSTPSSSNAMYKSTDQLDKTSPDKNKASQEIALSAEQANLGQEQSVSSQEQSTSNPENSTSAQNTSQLTKEATQDTQDTAQVTKDLVTTRGKQHKSGQKKATEVQNAQASTKATAVQDKDGIIWGFSSSTYQQTNYGIRAGNQTRGHAATKQALPKYDDAHPKSRPKWMSSSDN